MSATGFWLGITVGRVILGFVTPRIGEKLAIMVRSLPGRIRGARILLLIIISADLPPRRNGAATDFLAGSTVLRLGSGSFTTGLLSGTHVPSGGCGSHKDPSEALACLQYRVCGGVWRVGITILPFTRLANPVIRSGGALFPYAVGAIAQAKGVQVLQPIAMALLAVIFLLWLGLPKINKKLE